MENNTAFLTNVGLITSNGKWGQNVMSCEWTHQISHDPNLVIVCIRPGKATYENILETKEFGISIAAFDQNVLSSVAGNNHGKVVNKIPLLEEMGVEFYDAKTINTLMVSGAVLNAECKLIQHVDVGDHPLLIGEVQSYSELEKEPLIYHRGKYFKLGERIHKPQMSELENIEALIKKYTK